MSVGRDVIARCEGAVEEDIVCANCYHFAPAWSKESDRYPFPWCKLWKGTTRDEVFCTFWVQKEKLFDDDKVIRMVGDGDLC